MKCSNCKADGYLRSYSEYFCDLCWIDKLELLAPGDSLKWSNEQTLISAIYCNVFGKVEINPLFKLSKKSEEVIFGAFGSHFIFIPFEDYNRIALVAKENAWVEQTSHNTYYKITMINGQSIVSGSSGDMLCVHRSKVRLYPGRPQMIGLIDCGLIDYVNFNKNDAIAKRK